MKRARSPFGCSLLVVASLGAACSPAGMMTPDGAAVPPVDGAAQGADAVAVPEAGASDVAVRRLAQLLQGRFDTTAQAMMDPRFRDVTLAICRVSIPALAPHALYVEQAIRGSAPYRQRLYVLGSGANGATQAISRVFEFNEPSSVVGLCDMDGVQMFSPEDVVERPGCTVTLDLQGDRFVGRTDGRTCLSTLMGATYATTEITLSESSLDSWDRGYNAMDRQVWGSTAGAYRFARRSPLAPLE
jgi:CpeT protein